MLHKRTSWWIKLGIAASIAGIFAIAHVARSDHDDGPDSQSSTAAVPYDALQIAVAEDGQLVSPSEDDAAALRTDMVGRMRSSRRAAPAAKRHDDGTLSMVVGFDHLNFLTVHRGDDGALTFAHGEASDPEVEAIHEER